MRKQKAFFPVLACLLILGCVDSKVPPADFQGAVRLSDRPAVITGVVRQLLPSISDTIGLERITDVLLLSDTIVVLDRGPQITFLSSRLDLLDRWGREGEGPGEYLNPTAIAAGLWGLAVVDGGTSRATLLDHQGTVLETRSIGERTGNGVAVVGYDLVVPLMTDTHYLARIGPASLDPWGPRDHLPERDSVPLGPRMRAFEEDFVAAGPDLIHVLDGITGDIFGFSPEGSLQQKLVLPASFAEAMLAGAGATSSGPNHASYRPAFADFFASRDGRLVFLKAGYREDTEVVGGIIDPRQGILVPIVTDLPMDVWRASSSIRAVALLGEDLLVATGSGGLIVLKLKSPEDPR